MSLYFVILFKTTLHVSGVPCPSSRDLILPGQPFSIISPDDRQETPETCRVVLNKISK
jgi:hypothetical protein